MRSPILAIALAAVLISVVLASAQVDLSFAQAITLDTATNTVSTGSTDVTINGNIITLADSNTTDSLLPGVDLSGLVFPVIVRTNVSAPFLAGDPSVLLKEVNETVIRPSGNGKFIVELLGTGITIEASRPILADDSNTLIVEEFTQAQALSGTQLAGQSFSGATPPAQKYKLYIPQGASVSVSITSSGAHDVYVYAPSHPNYNAAYSSTSNAWWTYYNYGKSATGKFWKIWYPATSTSFTAPESGEYLFVVVKYSKDGSFTLSVQHSGGQQQTVTQTVTTGVQNNEEQQLAFVSLNDDATYILLGLGAVIILVLIIALARR